MFMKDFVTNTYTNGANEQELAEIRAYGKVAGGLSKYGVWRSAVKTQSVKAAQIRYESMKKELAA